MKLHYLLTATAVACAFSLLFVVSRGFGGSGETVIRFDSAGSESIELWAGNLRLGSTPFEISATQLKQEILAELPSAECAKTAEVGFVFNPQQDGTTVFQLSHDGGPHLRCLQHGQEVRVKVDMFKRSDSSTLRLTLKSAGVRKDGDAAAADADADASAASVR